MKTEKEILKERAIKNAGVTGEFKKIAKEPLEVLEFTLLNQKYAFERRFASEVHFLKEITTIPGAPDFVSGVIFHRGRIISLVNLRTLFKMKERGLTDFNKFIIISEKETYFGIITDSITGIAVKDKSLINQAPSTVDPLISAYIKGIFDDGVILLDALKLLTSPEIIVK